MSFLENTKDPRKVGERGGEIFESYPRINSMRRYPGFRADGKYNPAYANGKTRYEAENGTTDAKVISMDGASGDKYVGNLDTVGKHLELTVKVPSAGAYHVYVAFSNSGKTAGSSLYVNGGNKQDIRFEETGDGQTFIKKGVSVQLKAGENKLKLQKNSANTMNIDYIDVDDSPSDRPKG